MDEPGEDRQVVRQPGTGVAVEAEQVGRGVDRMRDQPAHDVGERVQPVREGRGDAEVPAAAAQRPEQIGVRVGVDLEHLAVGRDELDREQVVRGQSVLRHQPAEAAAEGQPGDPGRRDGAARDGEPVRARGVVQLAPEHAALGPHGRLLGVDLDALHLGEVDHHAAVRDRAAGDVVAAAADRHLETGRAPRARARRRRRLVVRQRTISAGRRSMRPLWTARASSYPASSGPSTDPDTFPASSATSVGSSVVVMSGVPFGI